MLKNKIFVKKMSVVFLLFIYGASTQPYIGRSQSVEDYNGFPIWSPTGTQIAFVSTRDGTHDIWLMNSDGSQQENLTPDYDNSIEIFPRWSPDGASIVFCSDVGGSDHLLQVFIGNRTTRDLFAGIDLEACQAEWSPDGTALTFLGRAHQSYIEVWMVSLEPQITATQITDMETFLGDPQWSPTGNQVSFLDFSEEASAVLRVVNINTREISSLFEEDIISYKWSPDGNLIAFNIQNETNYYENKIQILDVEEARIIAVSETTSYGIENLIWSPQSDGVLFQAICNSGTDIFYFDFNLNTLDNLTRCDTSNDALPNFSPDGQSIVFQSDHDGYFTIWIMHRDGSDQHKLVD